MSPWKLLITQEIGHVARSLTLPPADVTIQPSPLDVVFSPQESLLGKPTGFPRALRS